MRDRSLTGSGGCGFDARRRWLVRGNEPCEGIIRAGTEAGRDSSSHRPGSPRLGMLAAPIRRPVIAVLRTLHCRSNHQRAITIFPVRTWPSDSTRMRRPSGPATIAPSPPAATHRCARARRDARQRQQHEAGMRLPTDVVPASPMLHAPPLVVNIDNGFGAAAALYLRQLRGEDKQDLGFAMHEMSTIPHKIEAMNCVDEVAEVAYLSLHETGLKLAQVFDDAPTDRDFFGYPVCPLAQGYLPNCSQIVITSYKRGALLRNELVSIGFKREHIHVVASLNDLHPIESISKNKAL